MTEPTAATLRSVAAQLETLNPIAAGLQDGKRRVRPEIAAAIRPLGDHPVAAASSAVIALPNPDRRWWLSAAALKLRQEADALDDALENAAAEVESAKK